MVQFLSWLGAGRLPGVNRTGVRITSLFPILYKRFGPKGIGLVRDGEFEVYVNRSSLDSTPLVISGYIEPFETEVFKSVVREGMTVLDIGANFGHYTLLAARIVGNNGKVYSFEPTPETFKLLYRNVRKYGFKNALLINRAVSDLNGLSKFHVYKNFLHSNTLGNAPDASYCIIVPTISLDSFFGNGNVIDIIKMDIEGAETHALRGMHNLIKRSPDLVLLIEIAPKLLKGMDSSTEECIEELLRYFDLQIIVPKRKQLVPYESVSQAESFLVYSPRHIDLLCRRRQ